MNATWELSAGFITGMMVGLEFPDTEDFGEDVSFAAVLDLLIVRLVLIRWNIEKE